MLHGGAGSVEDERCGSLTPLRSIAPQKARKGIDSAPGAVYVLNDGVIVRFRYGAGSVEHEGRESKLCHSLHL